MIAFLDFSHHAVCQAMHNAWKVYLFLSSGRRVRRNLLGWEHSNHWLKSTLSTGPNPTFISPLFHLSTDTVWNTAFCSEYWTFDEVQKTSDVMCKVLQCRQTDYQTTDTELIRNRIQKRNATHYTKSKETASNLVVHISQMCFFKFCTLHQPSFPLTVDMNFLKPIQSNCSPCGKSQMN